MKPAAGADPANSATAAEPAAAVLPMVSVRDDADSETANGPVRGYVAKRTATGTKTDTPIIETPQSISVVGAEEMEIMKAQSLQDVLGYVAGVAWKPRRKNWSVVRSAASLRATPAT